MFNSTFDSDFGFGPSYSMSNIIFFMMFFAIFAIIIAFAIKGIKQWHHNNQQPILTIDARIVSRRTHVSSDSNFNNNMHHSSHTTYYVTFEVDSGSRMEFIIPSFEYGVLVEGDYGKLTFQGSRYLGFQRVFL